ncbi:MAG TPA: four helix bundle protein [Candidatus Marinimicrobia bacterium]|nr:four helix bundle protein [Candidatus Neomarinimicrobiota bacterium]HRS51832.1 four helix bundle protein [Candidatus Neomarinimicrobiota bacterium]HRU92707.1 four helix bundle protein [Candidatus Neomarinimicrobiota bacterium]
MFRVVHHWKDLEVWQLSHQLVIDIYQLTASFPKEEKFSLCDQIKRAAVSIPANIVEGHSKNSVKEFIRFLFISRGSLEEIRYLILLSKDLNFISENEYLKFEQILKNLSVKLNNLIHSLKEQ